MPNYDIGVLLAQNIRGLEVDVERIRNVSILLALAQTEKINLDPFGNRIKEIFKKFDEEEKEGKLFMKECQRKYK